jgi:hypothetical protein
MATSRGTLDWHARRAPGSVLHRARRKSRLLHQDHVPNPRCTSLHPHANSCPVLLESLPLQPPSDGWSANWVFWLRFELMEMMVSFVGNGTLSCFIPDLSFTFGKRLCAALGVSLAFTGTCLFAASTFAFPVPFTRQFGVIPVGVYSVATMRLVLGSFLSTRWCTSSSQPSFAALQCSFCQSGGSLQNTSLSELHEIWRITCRCWLRCPWTSSAPSS